MPLLPIVYYDSKILRTQALPVEKINEEIRRLAADMVETMDAAKGIGLAAPQVGKLLQIFVLRNYLEEQTGEMKISEDVQVYINPKIVSYGQETCFEEEGCVSIPGIRAPVERPVSIVIEALDLNGNAFKEEIFGYNARVRMHEYDHLRGILYVDRLDKRRRKKIEPDLERIAKRYRSR